MENITDIFEQFDEVVEKNGLEALLPQNLPDAIFYRMLKEADAIDNGKTEETPLLILFATVLQLSSGMRFKPGIQIQIEPDELMQNFSLYITTLRFEDSRRKGDIIIDDKSFPTVQNIFDGNKIISIKPLVD
ncbi:hypothetical protein [Hydrogenimonas thermophila]|uniref:Uncharacterized protein n=1 Tax=Hydrogenimonas thermophila TaxID=223786 RepID=A0A1I5TNP2_9BACT|nr:hypothetical protein [Hydrogenimonas thermophila]WOE71055.1 hypothetical protein RZR91_05640 [Hydrogenimonas thermophila]WOE73573.1 hypothetical protein RZR97_05620 [Hydrogenimonas thermophila]SFP84702.1 hypothetical protein SAMN05216234_14615 [Hydrogenimonas thermophila]